MTQQDIDPNLVIVNGYTIKSVKLQSRDDASQILVETDMGPKPFEQVSPLFMSINEKLDEAFVEVYAPVAYKNPPERDKIKNSIKEPIARILRDCSKEGGKNNPSETEITARDFLLLAYEAFGGKFDGKTILQKRLFFLSVIVAGDDLGYKPHYYGPYSSQVTEANSDLKSLGLVEEAVTKYGTDNRGFEVMRSDFKLTKAGQGIPNRKKFCVSRDLEENPKGIRTHKRSRAIELYGTVGSGEAFFSFSAAERLGQIG